LVDAVYHAWGAEVTIENAGATEAEAWLAITGKLLSVQGGEQVIARDQQSITENGPLAIRVSGEPVGADACAGSGDSDGATVICQTCAGGTLSWSGGGILRWSLAIRYPS